MIDHYGPATEEVAGILNHIERLTLEQISLMGVKRRVGSLRRWKLIRRLRQVAAGNEYQVRWERVNRAIRYEVSGSVGGRRAIRDAAIVTMMPSVLSHRSEKFLLEPWQAVSGYKIGF